MSHLDAPDFSRVASQRWRRWRLAAVAALIVLAVGLIFGQTARFEFLEFWDDQEYVSKNAQIKGGLSVAGIRWALTDGPFHEWHPLAVWSHMLDCQLYGLRPGGHHLTNVALHAAAAALLLVALARMTGRFWPSALVAALFAVHPLHVESVAWISERRDALSAVCLMLMLWGYSFYVDRPSPWRYLTVTLPFALGLMAKTSLVPAPLVLLLLDYWPLGRFEIATDKGAEPRADYPPRRRAAWLVAEKLPLLALALGASAIEMSMHVKGYDPLTLGQKIANALVSCVVYLGEFFYPAGLAAFYQHPGASLPLWKPAAALPLLLAITAAAIVYWRRYPYLAVGWFWYLLMVGPTLGLVQVGAHARADRYTYLSQIGLSIALAWGAADWIAAQSAERRTALSKVLAACAALWIVALAVCSWRQADYWRDDETLWRRAVAAAPSAHAHANLGYLLQSQEKIREAAEQFEDALVIDPAIGPINDPIRVRMFTKLGDIAARGGHTDEAIDDYRQALAIDPAYGAARRNLDRLEAAKQKAP